MKVLKKKLMAGLLTFAVAVSVLGTVTPASAASLTAKQYLTKMEKALKKVKSFEMTQTDSTKVLQAGQNSEAKNTTKAVIFFDPNKVKAVSTYKVTAEGNVQETETIAYIREDEQGNIYGYVSTDGSDYEETDLTDSYSEGVDIDTSMYSDVKIAKKSVKVNKINTVQISAKIKGSDMFGRLRLDEDTQLMLMLSGLDIDTLAPIKVTIWIDKKTYLPVKVTENKTASFNSIFKSMSDATGKECDVSYSVIKTTETYKNFNKATKFTFPEF